MVRLRLRYVVVAIRPADADCSDLNIHSVKRRRTQKTGGSIVDGGGVQSPTTHHKEDEDEVEVEVEEIPKASENSKSLGKRARGEHKIYTVEEWQDKKPLPFLSGVSQKQIYISLQRKIRIDFGDFGSATLGTSLQVKTLELRCGLMVLRVKRESFEDCRSLLEDAHDIGGHGPVKLQIVHVAGSTRLMQNAMERIHKAIPSFSRVPEKCWKEIIANAS